MNLTNIKKNAHQYLLGIILGSYIGLFSLPMAIVGVAVVALMISIVEAMTKDHEFSLANFCWMTGGGASAAAILKTLDNLNILHITVLYY